LDGIYLHDVTEETENKGEQDCEADAVTGPVMKPVGLPDKQSWNEVQIRRVCGKEIKRKFPPTKRFMRPGRESIEGESDY